KTLHVDARSEDKFTLTWKQGKTVISTLDVPRVAVERRYPELAATVSAEWRANGSHRDASDHELDQAVLHTGDHLPFGDILATIGALHAPTRAAKAALYAKPAFNVTFAVD